MATVYEIKIKTVSSYVNYNEAYIEKMFYKFLSEYKDDVTTLGFENIEIEVDKIA